MTSTKAIHSYADLFKNKYELDFKGEALLLNLGFIFGKGEFDFDIYHIRNICHRGAKVG